MSQAAPVAAPGPAARRFRLASPATALVAGAVVLALMIAEFPLASLAHQTVDAGGGGAPLWFSVPFGVIGFLVAYRKPGNRLGWILLGLAVFLAVAEDASFYVVACYRLRHGGLPFGWVALLAQPAWSIAIVLMGLAFLLFPLVLASLAGEPKHGYAITQDVAETMGVRLSAGTLYAVIARLEARGLIEPLETDDRRRPYRITMAGAKALAEQSERMSKVASVARERLSTSLGWAGA